MGFADAYLHKAGLYPELIRESAHPDLELIVCIPVHRESRLLSCLDSLFKAASHLEPSRDKQLEVLVLINAAEDAPEQTLELNCKNYDEACLWVAAHPLPFMDVHVLMDNALPSKSAGVGLARKILMDEAVRRFAKPEGILVSLDADTRVDENYFSALIAHFRDRTIEGCSIYFEHPLNREEDPFRDPGTTAPTALEENSRRDTEKAEPAGESGDQHYTDRVYDAISAYELHLRYYLQAVRSTGYPYAYHTVGSAFAVRAGTYVSEGGMNRRQGGEDFYFIQKVARRGHWNDCTRTRVLPSPRPSDRVPFGTGPAVARQTSGDLPLSTYHPEPFRSLGTWFSELDTFYLGESGSPDPVLADFLETEDFASALQDIRANCATLPAFRKRFWHWFNMFRIMKFLHFARDRGYPDLDVIQAARSQRPLSKGERAHSDGAGAELKELLLAYRKLQRNG